MTFAEFGLAEPIVRAVKAEGYSRPTPIQALAIPEAMTGRDLLGSAQTGTGKTAAFALPVLHRLSQTPPPAHAPARRIRALVLCPTRELAQQIADSFAVYGQHTHLRYTVIVGGVGQRPQTKAIERGVDILVATPGRLVDLQQQGWVDLRSVEIFVLDEADRMLDMGFLPDLQRIISQLPTRRQTLFFSATMPAPIAELAQTILKDPARIAIAASRQTTDLVDQSVCFVPKQHKSRTLTSFLMTRDIARVIVFTRTKHGADRVVEQLLRTGIRAEAIHGNKSQAARQKTLANFKSNKPPVLVATDLAARGIDVDGVSHVLNFDLPIEPETYVHRIGRTGRAGATGVAVSFCDETERKQLKAIERLLRKALPIDKSLSHSPAEMPPDVEAESAPKRARIERRPPAGRRRPEAARSTDKPAKPARPAAAAAAAPVKPTGSRPAATTRPSAATHATSTRRPAAAEARAAAKPATGKPSRSATKATPAGTGKAAKPNKPVSTGNGPKSEHKPRRPQPKRPPR